MPTVISGHIPGIRPSVHRIRHPQRSLHGLVVEHRIVPQNLCAALERMDDDLLIGIAAHIEAIPLRDFVALTEVHFITFRPSPGQVNPGYLPTKEVPRLILCGVSTPGGSASG